MTEPLPTVARLRAALDAGEVSAAELLARALARAEAVDPALGILVGTRADAARGDALASDARREQGAEASPLDGIPVVVKDNMAQRGEPVGCGSRILEGYRSPFDATAVERLRRSGAVIVGRANMDEFAMGSSTEHSVHGPTRNPWDPSRSPGGSSGGSAAAVAAGIVPLAFGSDTGGSIRQPASFTGIVGMKPTYGRVSRKGLVAYASSLDQIGPLAHTAEDCAIALDVVSGHDPGDATSLPEPPLDSQRALDAGLEGLRIGLPREYFETEGASPEVLGRVRDAVAVLEASGAKTVEVSLPHTRHAIACYYLVATAEASSNLARFDGARYGRRAEGVGDIQEMYERSRSEGFGTEVKRRILLGTFVLSAGYYDAYYKKAGQVRTLLRRDFECAFEGCDVLLTPTAPEPAFAIGEKADPLSMYLSDVYTVSANLAGLPALSMPCGLAGGLPVGVQLLGAPGEDVRVLQVAHAFQRSTDFHEALPPGLTS